MSNDASRPITIFWSWQSDSPSQQNTNFIGDCIERAAKDVTKQDAKIIFIDRDTKGLGGTPDIANSILTKIRNSDLFIWDATLVFADPKPSPNPNVLIEFGYALATLGTGRIIGVMNIENGRKGEALPFDLAHRRWPIDYCLRVPSNESNQEERAEFLASRKKEREALVSILAKAIREALKEEKKGAFYLDGDYIVAKQLWDKISSEWITGWVSFRLTNPQYEEKEILEILDKYIRLVGRPEFIYKNEALQHTHDELAQAIHKHLKVSAEQRIPDGDSMFIISIKRMGYVKDYDAKYDRQVKAIRDSLDEISDKWAHYVTVLRTLYPEIVY